MRRATLSQPPVFAVSERLPGRVTLASDIGALAHIFVLEQDIVRLLLLPDGTIKGGPSWLIAPGAEELAEPGRDRMSVEGFTCPEFALSEADGTLADRNRAIPARYGAARTSFRLVAQS